MPNHARLTFDVGRRNMIYVILAAQLAVLGLIAVFVVRLFRAKPEQRPNMMRPKRKPILIVVGASVAAFVVVGGLIFFFFGPTGVRATSAAKDYLGERYGPRDTWEISLSEHVERSKKPEAGFYRLHYRYGEKEGDLVAEYFERDGKLAFNITPREK